MTVDREETLRKAERLLRQGRLDSAIAEYVRVVEAQPRDWATANALGDLFVRTGQLDKAVSQFARIADQLFCEGFLPKAAALYKKILKIAPENEAAHLQLAEVSARQGLFANARVYLSAVAERRRRRGDGEGADAALRRMASIDPADFESRVTAARSLAEAGDTGGVEQLRAIATELEQQGRQAESTDILREVTRLDPSDVASHARIVRACLASGALETAREHLSDDVAGEDPVLLTMLAEMELRAGALDVGRALLRKALAADSTARENITRLGVTLRQTDRAAAYACAEAVASAACAAGDFQRAVEALEDFVRSAPGYEPAIVQLIEVCLEGGFPYAMRASQGTLADACLDAGRPREARFIIDDLLADAPENPTHRERLARALAMLGEEPEPAQEPSAEAVAPDAIPAYTEPQDQAADDGLLDRDTFESAPVPSLVEIDLTSQLAALADDDPREAVILPVLSHASEARADSGEGPASAPALPEPPPALDEVFQGFRDEVMRQRSEEAAVQQYKLALTYREMGMLEEATAALQIAARSPQHRFEASSLLADLFLERRMPAAAIDWFERAAETPPPSEARGRALLYRLGGTLASLGEPARALAVFLELQADAGDYRDVHARIEELSRAQAGG